MNNLQVFKNQDFSIEALSINNEPYFLATQVSKILGYTNPQKAIRDHVDIEGLRTEQIVHPYGGKQETKLINESGLYSLILSSKLENAKKFKRWVTSEVLPAIRNKGVYMTDAKAYDITHNPGSLADLLLQAGEQLKQKDLVIKEMKPKALFADAVETSHTSILVGDTAKILRQNGVENMGGNRLFQWLRDKGYLIKRAGTDYNMPTQYSMELGLFEVKETAIARSNGTMISRTPKITGKGQQYFVNKFLGDLEC